MKIPGNMAVMAAVCAVVTAASAFGVEPELQLSPLFSDHAVLQRDVPIRIRGSATAGGRVHVAFAHESREAVADQDGNWTAEFSPLPAGGPHEIRVNSEGEELVTSDILIGDLWVCSGQSNMGWTLADSIGGKQAAQRAGNPNLRVLKVDRRTSSVRVTDAETDGWKTDNEEAVLDFSGVGYFYGSLLQERVGVPIGLIEASWGGTPAEAWTPREMLEGDDEWATDIIETIADYDLTPEELEVSVARYEEIHKAYLDAALQRDVGTRDGWRLPAYDDSEWTPIQVPGYWEPTLGSIDGIVWYRYEFELSESEASGDIEINLGNISEYDDTYVNGKLVGRWGYEQKPRYVQERVYQVDSDVLCPGRNVIAVRIVDTRTAGGFGSPRETLVMKTNAGQRSLSGQWRAKVSHDAQADGGFPLEGERLVPAARQYYRPCALYNGMIHPLVDLGVRGVIWYQGEANIRRAEAYGSLFPAMIEGWRRAFLTDTSAGPMPFLFVQLPAFRPRNDRPEESSWAELREAQSVALQLDNTAMAVTVDLGQADNIHPRDKLPVAERLVDLAALEVYGQNVPTAHSPMVQRLRSDEGRRVVLELIHAEGLATTDGQAPRGFAMAGADGVFEWAQAELRDGTITIECPEVPEPQYVRYAWAWNPDVNTVNAGLKPLAPFRASLVDGVWLIGGGVSK